MNNGAWPAPLKSASFPFSLPPHPSSSFSLPPSFRDFVQRSLLEAAPDNKDKVQAELKKVYLVFVPLPYVLSTPPPLKLTLLSPLLQIIFEAYRSKSIDLTDWTNLTLDRFILLLALYPQESSLTPTCPSLQYPTTTTSRSTERRPQTVHPTTPTTTSSCTLPSDQQQTEKVRSTEGVKAKLNLEEEGTWTIRSYVLIPPFFYFGLKIRPEKDVKKKTPAAFAIPNVKSA